MNEKWTINGLVQLNERNVKRIRDIGIWLFLFVIIVYSFNVSNVDPGNLISGLGFTARLIGEMYPPNLRGLQSDLSLAMITIAIGIVATIIGFFLAFPLCFLAARNTTTGPITYNVARGIVTFCRTIPDMVWALVFIVAFGLGPVPGILCLTLCTVGLLTKFYSEAVESIDPKPMEALIATGSHNLGVIRHAILPQVIPVFTSYTLYMLDSNIRGAVTVGIIGAGGIGVELYIQMEMLHFSNVATILIVIVAMVVLINRISAYLRKGIIDGTIFRGSRKIYDALIVVVAAIIGTVAVFWTLSQIDYNLLIAGGPKAYFVFSTFWPPDFSNFDLYTSLMVQTIAMAISGTTIAVLLSLPLAILMSRNITKNKIVNNVVRECVNLLRAIPEMIMGILFVAAVGLGPFAGVLAIALHSVGVLTEFFAGAIENIDPGPGEAVQAAGARLIQRVRHTVLPQIYPIFTSNNLYILDRNIRASSIMGMVGAGGIGWILIQAFEVFDFQHMIVILGIMIVTIFAVDTLSAYIRKRVV